MNQTLHTRCCRFGLSCKGLNSANVLETASRCEKMKPLWKVKRFEQYKSWNARVPECVFREKWAKQTWHRHADVHDQLSNNWMGKILRFTICEPLKLMHVRTLSSLSPPVFSFSLSSLFPLLSSHLYLFPFVSLFSSLSLFFSSLSSLLLFSLLLCDVCCAVLCCAVLCCAVLCCGVLWCAVLWCAVVWCGVVWCVCCCVCYCVCVCRCVMCLELNSVFRWSE